MLQKFPECFFQILKLAHANTRNLVLGEVLGLAVGEQLVQHTEEATWARNSCQLFVDVAWMIQVSDMLYTLVKSPPQYGSLNFHMVTQQQNKFEKSVARDESSRRWTHML